MPEDKLYLAIDPGKDKCGFALVKDNQTPVLLDIVGTKEFDKVLKELYDEYRFDLIILGTGTYSQKIEKKIREINLSPVVLVNEENTTIQAERKYREDHPLKGYKKILSKIVDWRPAKNVDDYAAFMIAKKYLENKNN
ncbi:MAG: hypothetical protein ACQEQD_04905 [Bacillota bacterium]